MGRYLRHIAKKNIFHNRIHIRFHIYIRKYRCVMCIYVYVFMYIYVCVCVDE